MAVLLWIAGGLVAGALVNVPGDRRGLRILRRRRWPAHTRPGARPMRAARDLVVDIRPGNERWISSSVTSAVARNRAVPSMGGTTHENYMHRTGGQSRRSDVAPAGHSTLARLRRPFLSQVAPLVGATQ